MQLAEDFLELIQETKISELLKDASRERNEASGVCLKDDYLHIIFDDAPLLLRLRRDWWCDGEGPSLLDLDGTGAGYEDLTYQSSTGRWYLLIEAAKTDSGAFMPRVDEFDESFAFIKSYWLPFPLESGNKGLEGLSTLYYAGNDYLLGLCEGNNCKGGGAGLRPGKGRIQAFRRVGESWEYAGTIKLPGKVRYKDYSSLDIYNGYLTVLSQASSSMWVGRIRGRSSGLVDLFEDEGRLFLFPRDEKGRIIYCNPEGVTWIGNDRIAVVSDKAKDGQPEPCAIKDQSVHIFRLGTPGLTPRPEKLND